MFIHMRIMYIMLNSIQEIILNTPLVLGAPLSGVLAPRVRIWNLQEIKLPVIGAFDI